MKRKKGRREKRMEKIEIKDFELKTKEEQIFEQRIDMFLEERNWERVIQYSERLLDINPQNIKAHLGELMADCKVTKKSDLAFCKKSFSEHKSYKRLLVFAEEVLIEELKGYLLQIENNIKKSKEIVKQRKTFALKLTKICAIISAIVFLIVGINIWFINPSQEYKKAILHYESYEYEKAYEKFEKLGSYKDSKEKLKEIKERNWVYLSNGVVVKIPYNDEYVVSLTNDIIYLSGTGKNFPIIDFLPWISAPSDKSWAGFEIKDYETSRVQYFEKGEYVTQVLDLYFLEEKPRFVGKYFDKRGIPPLIVGGYTSYKGAALSYGNSSWLAWGWGFRAQPTSIDCIYEQKNNMYLTVKVSVKE